MGALLNPGEVAVSSGTGNRPEHYLVVERIERHGLAASAVQYRCVMLHNPEKAESSCVGSYVATFEAGELYRVGERRNTAPDETEPETAAEIVAEAMSRG